ncbi:MAG: hypothetical protein ACXWMO_07050 [Syntrophales bacterium]
MRIYMSWQDEYKSKLMTAEEAVKKVNSNDAVAFGLSLGAPTAHLVDALLARAGEVTGVRILDAVPIRPMKLYDPDFMNSVRESFTYSSLLYNPLNRKLAQAKMWIIKVSIAPIPANAWGGSAMWPWSVCAVQRLAWSIWD